MSDNLNNQTISKNKLQEINDLLMLIEKEDKKNKESELLLDTIVECLTPTRGINKELGDKIKDIILRGELVRKLQDETTFNLPDEFNNLQLSSEEQENLQKALEERLKEKDGLFLKHFNELTDSNFQDLDKVTESMKIDVETEKNNLLSLENDLLDALKTNMANLNEIRDKLNELVILKTEETLDVEGKKIQENQDETDKSNLRQRILISNLHVDILNELPITMNAYSKALKDLKEQQKEYADKIAEVKHEIENYNIVAKNEEFQEILKDFKQYQRAIENRIMISKEMMKDKN